MKDDILTIANLEVSGPNIIEKLPEEERKKAEDIAKSIDITQSAAISQFGAQTQSEISRLSDQVLVQIRTKDSGYAGEILSDLMSKIKQVDIESFSSKNGFFMKIPFIGGLFNSAKRLLMQYQKVGAHIEEIEAKLDDVQMQLIKDNAIMDMLFKKNIEHVRDLTVYIAAGQLKIKELRERDIPDMQRSVQLSSNSPEEVQNLNDLVQFTERFEKKVYDLSLSRMIAIQTAPQLRLIQNNNQLLIDKMQSSLLNIIPLWKNQIVIAISVFRQKKALEMQRELANETNNLIKKNAELLRSNNSEILKENTRGLIEIETLKEVHFNLISTLEETVKIQEEGRSKRREAEAELVKMEEEMKRRISEITGRDKIPPTV